MANSKNPLSSSSLWKTAWIATMACKKSIGTLLFAGIFLPRALLDFVYDDKSILLSKSLQLMASDNQYIYRHRLAAGEGVLCHNVLHNRTAFEDDESQQRLILRARYFDRITN